MSRHGRLAVVQRIKRGDLSASAIPMWLKKRETLHSPPPWKGERASEAQQEAVLGPRG